MDESLLLSDMFVNVMFVYLTVSQYGSEYECATIGQVQLNKVGSIVPMLLKNRERLLVGIEQP
jgi:hypothetical protein